MLTEHAARLAAHAHTAAICLDFDGTLAPIVDDPNEARPLPGTVELLGHLAARFAAVALLSGRPADYLAKHAAAPGVRYLGLYGLQEIRDGHVWVDPRLEAARPAVMAAQQDLRDCAAVRDSALPGLPHAWPSNQPDDLRAGRPRNKPGGQLTEQLNLFQAVVLPRSDHRQSAQACHRKRHRAATCACDASRAACSVSIDSFMGFPTLC